MKLLSNNKKTNVFVSLSFLLSCIATTKVFALPSGAGGCDGNGPAVGGLHLSAAEVITGTLEEGNLTVQVNNDISDADLETDFLATTEEEIPVRLSTATTTTTDKQFKGFLIRLGAAPDSDGSDDTDYTSALETPEGGDESIQLSSLCEAQNAAGLTHTTNDLKSEATGTIILPAMTSDRRVMLDVTVVYSNANGVSEYYHSGYMLQVDADGNGSFEEPTTTTTNNNNNNNDEDTEDNTDAGNNNDNDNEDENETAGGNDENEEDTVTDDSAADRIVSSFCGGTSLLTIVTMVVGW